MRSLAPLLLPLVLSALGLSLGCSDSRGEGEWVPVPNAAPTAPEVGAVDEETREQVRQLAMEARVNKMRAAFVSDEEARCTSDADCELTSHHCCNCAAGGSMAGVNNDSLTEVLRRRGVVCADYACAQVVSTDPTCAAERAVCREGKCVPDLDAAQPPPVEGVGVEPIPEAP